MTVCLHSTDRPNKEYSDWSLNVRKFMFAASLISSDLVVDQGQIV